MDLVDRAARATRRSVVEPRAASCASRPAATSADLRGGRWSVEGELEALDLSLDDGACASDALPRRARPALVGARRARARGDVLVSAEPGYEFVDWGGARPRGRRQPRLAAPRRLARRARDVRARRAAEREQWAIRDVTPAGARPLRATLVTHA